MRDSSNSGSSISGSLSSQSEIPYGRPFRRIMMQSMNYNVEDVNINTYGRVRAG